MKSADEILAQDLLSEGLIKAVCQTYVFAGFYSHYYPNRGFKPKKIIMFESRINFTVYYKFWFKLVIVSIFWN